MKISHQASFASNEYIERWFAQIQSNQLKAEDIHVTIPSSDGTGNSTNAKKDVSISRAQLQGFYLGPEAEDCYDRKRRHEYHFQEKDPGGGSRDGARGGDGLHSETAKQRQFKHRASPPQKSLEAQVGIPQAIECRGELDVSSKSKLSQISTPLSVSGPPEEESLCPQSRNEDPSEVYRRRPRHKTKLDKYEYKGFRKSLDYNVIEPKRKLKRKRRGQKSGMSLNEDFAAPNASQSRLTLKSSSGPGIFNKGKASATIPTHGLPDLTFSEMTFLTKRRRLDDARFQKLNNAKSTPRKIKGSALEISNFFSRPPNEAAEFHRTVERNSHGSTESSVASRLLLRPSPTKVNIAKDLTTSQSSSSLHWEKSGHCQDQVTSRTHRTARQATPKLYRTDKPGLCYQPLSRPTEDKTSEYSLSVMPSRRCSAQAISHQGYFSADMREMAVARCTTPDPIQLSSELRSPLRDPREISPSDRSLEMYTRHALLNQNQGFWVGAPQFPDRTKLYSLDDLKDLARIAELEEDEPGQFNLESKSVSLAKPPAVASSGEPYPGNYIEDNRGNTRLQKALPLDLDYSMYSENPGFVHAIQNRRYSNIARGRFRFHQLIQTPQLQFDPTSSETKIPTSRAKSTIIPNISDSAASQWAVANDAYFSHPDPNEQIGTARSILYSPGTIRHSPTLDSPFSFRQVSSPSRSKRNHHIHRNGTLESRHIQQLDDSVLDSFDAKIMHDAHAVPNDLDWSLLGVDHELPREQLSVFRDQKPQLNPENRFRNSMGLNAENIRENNAPDPDGFDDTEHPKATELRAEAAGMNGHRMWTSSQDKLFPVVEEKFAGFSRPHLLY